MRVWQDPWVPSGNSFIPRPRDPEEERDENLKVVDLVIPNTCIQNEVFVRHLFLTEDAESILRMHLPSSHRSEPLVEDSQKILSSQQSSLGCIRWVNRNANSLTRWPPMQPNGQLVTVW